MQAPPLMKVQILSPGRGPRVSSRLLAAVPEGTEELDVALLERHQLYPIYPSIAGQNG